MNFATADPKFADRKISGNNAGFHRITADLPSRRVTCDTIKGSTSLGVLHAIAQKARGSKWFCEELEETFARGKSMPLP